MPKTLTDIFPDPELLLKLSPDDLAPVVLQLARDRPQPSGLVHPAAIFEQVHGPIGQHEKGYPQQQKDAVERALNEAWQVLVENRLVIREPGVNGNNGYHRISERAAAITSATDFEHYRDALKFPKSLLHHALHETAWMSLARGEWDEAVTRAMKAVEEAVRHAGGFGAGDYGVVLMRAAFNPEKPGPLTDPSAELAERKGMADLFAGTFGAYRNSVAHRTVGIGAAKARELVMLASHLLRIVDDRRP
ncbi:MAG TPA: TIGR02391 family protein [Burkholderiales bacterium]|nr:TIGR02391 family protein [Burkholderiales bacterium]